ncbi:hypothetical protein [Gulbenkiania mobilis]|uniref:hypothetical protein n=1 Tax=Gulbenkiania mobilis TaxID=397457 RepID=UPI0006BBE2D1|nr:hypothetical protein [Gulbenkiania mobilis]
MTSKTDAERQAALRARRKAAGLNHLSIWLDARTTKRLRNLAREHNVPHAQVVTAGILAFERMLAARKAPASKPTRVAANPSTAATAPALAASTARADTNPLPDQQSAAAAVSEAPAVRGEPWWPENTGGGR